MFLFLNVIVATLLTDNRSIEPEMLVPPRQVELLPMPRLAVAPDSPRPRIRFDRDQSGSEEYWRKHSIVFYNSNRTESDRKFQKAVEEWPELIRKIEERNVRARSKADENRKTNPILIVLGLLLGIVIGVFRTGTSEARRQPSTESEQYPEWIDSKQAQLK